MSGSGKDPLSGLQMDNFLMPAHMVERDRERERGEARFLVSVHIRTPIPSRGLHPHDLI